MNFYALNIQRKLIFISAVAGVISVFLPWFSEGAYGINVHINGLHKWGIVAFFCFAAAVAIGLTGKQTETLNNYLCFAAIISGILSLLSVIITLMSFGADTFGAVEAKKGLGIWLALIASVCIAGFAFKFKRAEHIIKAETGSLRKPVTPAIIERNAKALIEIDKIAELERLSRLKENGSLTEEEFQQLKSKLL